MIIYRDGLENHIFFSFWIQRKQIKQNHDPALMKSSYELNNVLLSY